MQTENLFEKFYFFLRDVIKEVKKINWPTKEETIRYTIIVVGISLGVAIYLGGFDAIFNYLITKFIFK